MKRKILVLLSLCMVFCIFFVSPVFAKDIAKNTDSQTNAYSSNWKYWSQGASQYVGSKMQGYGCRVVAQAKLLVEAGIASSDTTIFNPDKYIVWAHSQGYFGRKSSSFTTYIGEQAPQGKAPVGYADMNGQTLNYNGQENFPNTVVAQQNEIIMNKLNQGYYIILGSNAHHVYVLREESLAAGIPILSNSQSDCSYRDKLVISHTDYRATKSPFSYYRLYSLAISQPPLPPQKAYVNCPGKNLVINSQPDPGYKIGSMPHGAEINIYPAKAVGKWMWVEYNGVQGYASSNLISSTPTVCTSHVKGEFQWFESAHPHYNYYKCANCGELFTDGTTAYHSTCPECNPTPPPAAIGAVTGILASENQQTQTQPESETSAPHVHTQGDFVRADDAHPHNAYYRCAVCGAEFQSGTMAKDNCEICNPPQPLQIPQISLSSNTIKVGNGVTVYWTSAGDGAEYKLAWSGTGAAGTSWTNDTSKTISAVYFDQPGNYRFIVSATRDGQTVESGYAYLTVEPIEIIRPGIVTGTNGKNLAINDAPGASPDHSNKIGRIPPGGQMNVYIERTSGNWYWVEYNGIQGYAYKKYITLQ